MRMLERQMWRCLSIVAVMVASLPVGMADEASVPELGAVIRLYLSGDVDGALALVEKRLAARPQDERAQKVRQEILDDKSDMAGAAVSAGDEVERLRRERAKLSEELEALRGLLVEGAPVPRPVSQPAKPSETPSPAAPASPSPSPRGAEGAGQKTHPPASGEIVDLLPVGWIQETSQALGSTSGTGSAAAAAPPASSGKGQIPGLDEEIVASQGTVQPQPKKKSERLVDMSLSTDTEAVRELTLTFSGERTFSSTLAEDGKGITLKVMGAEGPEMIKSLEDEWIELVHTTASQGDLEIEVRFRKAMSAEISSQDRCIHLWLTSLEADRG